MKITKGMRIATEWMKDNNVSGNISKLRYPSIGNLLSVFADDTLTDIAYWKSRCEAAEEYINAYVLLDQFSTKEERRQARSLLIKWQKLNQQQ